jgi:hypothetical protein
MKQIVGFLCLCAAAHGGLVVVTSQGALSPNDAIIWSQLTPDNTFLSSPQSVVSNLGLGATVATDPVSGLTRYTEGLTWGGDFPHGDFLIAPSGNYDVPMTITFASPVFGAGAYIEADTCFIDPNCAGAFTMTLDVYNGVNKIASYSEMGTGSYNEGTAIFLGVLDTTQEITSVVFNWPGGNDAFAVDALELNTPGVAGVPEPGTLALLGAGMGAIALIRRKRS